MRRDWTCAFLPGSNPDVFVHETDYARMRDLLRRPYSVSGPEVALTVGDLDFWRHQRDSPPLEETCRLWVAPSGELSGFVWATPGWIDAVVAPDRPGALRPMLDRAEGFLRQTAGGGSNVSTTALDRHPWHEAELVRRGYERTKRFHHWYLARSLIEPIPVAPVPEVRLATVREVSRLAETVALFDRTGAAPAFTVEGWRAQMASPTYRPELDLLALAPDPVAHCTGWFDEASETLLVEPVGCHPAHRRRGLARDLRVAGDALAGPPLDLGEVPLSHSSRSARMRRRAIANHAAPSVDRTTPSTPRAGHRASGAPVPGTSTASTTGAPGDGSESTSWTSTSAPVPGRASQAVLDARIVRRLAGWRYHPEPPSPSTKAATSRTARARWWSPGPRRASARA